MKPSNHHQLDIRSYLTEKPAESDSAMIDLTDEDIKDSKMIETKNRGSADTKLVQDLPLPLANEKDKKFREAKSQVKPGLTEHEQELLALFPQRSWWHSDNLPLLKARNVRSGWHSTDENQPPLFITDSAYDKLKWTLLQQMPLKTALDIGFPIVAPEQWLLEGGDWTDPNCGCTFYDSVTHQSFYLRDQEELIHIYGLGPVSVARQLMGRAPPRHALSVSTPIQGQPLLAGEAVFDKNTQPVKVELYDYITDIILDIREDQEPDLKPLLDFIAKTEPRPQLPDFLQECLTRRLLLAEDCTEVEALVQRHQADEAGKRQIEKTFKIKTDSDATRFERNLLRYTKHIPELAIEPTEYGDPDEDGNQPWTTFDLSGIAAQFSNPRIRGRSKWDQIVLDNNNPPRTVKELRKISRHWFGKNGKIRNRAQREGFRSQRVRGFLLKCIQCKKQRIIDNAAPARLRGKFKCRDPIAVHPDIGCGQDDEYFQHDSGCYKVSPNFDACTHYFWMKTDPILSGRYVT